MRRQWNDPAIGQAFGNLAQMFAPPGGSDMAGFAQARLSNQEAEQLAALFDYAQQTEGFDQGLFDRKAIAAGRYNPNQSFYSVDQADATARRGQDIGMQTQLGVQGMRNDQSGREAVLGAVVNPQGRQAIDQDMLGAIFPQLGGVGFDAAGPVAPTEAQVRGSDRQRLTDSGALSDEMLVAEVMGNTPVENIATPEGPRTVYRTDAVGQEPFINRGAEAARRPVTLIGPDGAQLPGSFDPQSGGYFLQDGTPAPENFRAASLAQPTGSNEDLGLTTTGQNRADTQFINATRSLEVLEELDELLAANPGATGIAGGIQRITQNLVQTVDEVGQLFDGGFAPEDLVNNGMIDEDTYNIHFNRAFNPNLAEIDILFNQLIWAYAAGQQNDGRVSNQQMEQARSSLGIDGSLSNTAQARAALNRLRGQFRRDRASAARLANPNVIDAYDADLRRQATGGEGQAAPQQAPGQGGAGDMPRITTDEEFNALPSGARFIDPEGNVRQKP